VAGVSAGGVASVPVGAGIGVGGGPALRFAGSGGILFPPLKTPRPPRCGRVRRGGQDHEGTWRRKTTSLPARQQHPGGLFRWAGAGRRWMRGWMRPAVPVRGMLVAKILQRLGQRHTPAGTEADPLRNMLERLRLQNRMHTAVCALCQGLLEHTSGVRQPTWAIAAPGAARPDSPGGGCRRAIPTQKSYRKTTLCGAPNPPDGP
jgi:hypothetical protein